MSNVASPVPDGHQSIMAYITVKDAARAIEFYLGAFTAVELCRFVADDGRVSHAELRMGDSRLLLADEYPEWGLLSPRTLGGTPLSLMIYVKDADAVQAQALSMGARELQPVADWFYGDRRGVVLDASGHRWIIATHKRDVPDEEMARGAAERHGLTMTSAEES